MGSSRRTGQQECAAPCRSSPSFYVRDKEQLKPLRQNIRAMYSYYSNLIRPTQDITGNVRTKLSTSIRPVELVELNRTQGRSSDRLIYVLDIFEFSAKIAH